jgi:uncharacterized membrane protein
MPDAPLPPAGTPDPNTTAPDNTGLAPNVAAGLACLFTIVGGIVFLVLEKKDRFVRLWAMQSLFLGGLAIAVSILVAVASVILGFIPWIGPVLIFLIWLANLVFGIGWCVVYVITVAKAFSGKEWEIPWLGKLARRQLAQTDRQDAPAAE